ncbi:MAG: Peptidase family [Bacteroidetes bacterium]|nr:Peptidase family [Bacteroidota bacterium]
MKLKIFILIHFLILTFSYSYTQNFNNDFPRLESKGPIPKDFSKYINNSKYENTTLQYLFKSGFILYGTELNDYLDHIMDLILKDEPEIRKKMRVYIYNSPVVNAMAFDDFIIIVNTGLLAQVQNESELAFILSHEMIHIVNKHSEKRKTEKKRSKKNDKTQSTKDVYKDQFMSYHYRSREHEFESDKVGFEKFYKNSGYDVNAVDGVFDVLLYSYLPFDEITFNKSFVENKYYSFPKEYFLVNLTPIRSREDYIDTLSTHPNIAKRRIVIDNLVSKFEGDPGATFIQSEELFYKIRDIARCEAIRKLLIVHDYGNAFYNTFIMLQKYPESETLQSFLVASLYGISRHKQYSSFSDVVTDYKLNEGEIQQTNYFFKKIKKEELSILALRFAWKNSQQFPDNPYFYQIAEDISTFLFNKEHIMAMLDPGFNIDSVDVNIKIKEVTVEDDETEESQRTENRAPQGQLYEEPKKKGVESQFQYAKKPTLKFNESDVLQYKMLKELLTDPQFVQWIAIQKNKYQPEGDTTEEELINKKLQDCQKILVWNPNLYIVKGYNDYSNKPQRLKNAMTAITKETSVAITVMDNSSFNNFDTEQYNHYCNMQSLNYDRNYAEDVKMVNYTGAYIQKTLDYFGTSYISFVDAIIAPRDFTSGRIEIILVAPLVPFIAPVTLVHIFAPNRSCWVGVSILNTKTGDQIFYDEQVNGYNNHAFINNYIYSIFHNLKKGEKK